MSHRVYLYNVSEPSQAQSTDKMMMEWGYEMPLLLQPLLVDGGFAAGNNYNNHTELDNTGLYFNARTGIENMKRFYDFLEKQESLIENKEAFIEAKNNLLHYLEKLELPYFHLDAWDVFNMDDIPHAEQAETWLSNINHNNEIITRAMENDDISMLRYSDFRDVSPGFKSFAELLNYEDYQYGWEHIWQSEEDRDELIFEENGLWGLKDKSGNVVLSPQFEAFYSFGSEDLAVVVKDGKYGYVHVSGHIAIPLVWDDAFDFEYGSASAIVKLNDKFGLIDIKGQPVSQMQYESLEVLGYDGYFTAKLDGKWGVLDNSGSVIINFEHDAPFESGDRFYHTAIEGQKNRKIFNGNFTYIGEFPVSALECIGDGFILVKAHKNVNHNTLYKKDGTVLASGFDKINRQTGLSNMLILRKGKKYGALGMQQESFLLPYEYDALIDMQVNVDASTSNLVLAQKDGEKGVFRGDIAHPSWLIPLDHYNKIVWLYEHYFALQQNGVWCIMRLPDNFLSGYEFDLVTRKMPLNGFAYAFKGSEVFTADAYGLSRADKALVLEEIESGYDDYYFDVNVRNRLLAYAKTDVTDDGGMDEYSPVETLHDLGLDALQTDDFETSIRYNTLAAEKGYAPAMNTLAYIYYSIEGCLDENKAFYWYEKGAAAGSIYAMNGLGMCYSNGTGTAPDAEKALYWLGRAAHNGNAIANNNLGELYFQGQLVSQNIDKAIYHYEQGEAFGTPHNDWLGYLHYYKGNYDKAMHYFQRDYEDGGDFGAYYMGIFYSEGLGTAKNIAEAIAYFNAAADKSYPLAHIELAKIYLSESDFADEALAKYHIAQAEKAGLEIPDDLRPDHSRS